MWNDRVATYAYADTPPCTTRRQHAAACKQLPLLFPQSRHACRQSAGAVAFSVYPAPFKAPPRPPIPPSPACPPLPAACLGQTWDNAQQAAWDAWANARAYAGGNWDDAKRNAESYWKDTKGG